MVDLLRDEGGQILPWAALTMTVTIGFLALVTDVGNAMVAYRRLQAGSNAAVLAGAQEMPKSDYASVAQQYGSATGGYNSSSNLTNVVTTVTGKCLNTLTSWGLACQTPTGGGTAYNALVVTQTAQVPTYFAGIFGVKSISLTSSATAAMRGSAPIPYNIAIILDTTRSMQDSDSDSQCNSTRLACALSGVQVLLQNIVACNTSLNACGAVTSGSYGAGNIANAVNHVSLFTFPNATVGTVPNDYGCSGTNPTVGLYVFPPAGASSYTPGTDPSSSGQTYTASTATSAVTYQVVGYSSDFKTAGSTTSLSAKSNLVKAVGGSAGCTPMAAPGGTGTYYAGAIYAAQASLVAEQAAFSGTQNVIIIISDGDATESASDLSAPGSKSSSGTYPSYSGECQQAVTAAQTAAAAGTRVYSVAYGAESSGCSGESLTPCQTMKGIASNSSYFYSDYTQSGGSTDNSCIGTATSTSNLNQIFQEIAYTFTSSRLIPNGTS